MKNVKEQLDYGDRPERMDPNLERKLASPESLYGSNPAMRKGPKDVQRLVSNRFQKVAEKLSQVTGIEDLSSRNVQQMLIGEMMRKTMQVMSIESRYTTELERLAVEVCLEETEIPSDWFIIEPYLNRQPSSDRPFKFKPDEDEDEDDDDDEVTKFDFELDLESKLDDEDKLELERHKRNIINAIIQGSAKKGHYIFQKPDVKSALDQINPQLYENYLAIMAINDFLYFTQEQMIEMMSSTGSGVAGKVSLEDSDDEGDGGGQEGDEGDDSPDTKIVAFGLMFPILCHEIIKGIEEAKGRYGLPEDPDQRQKVTGKTDILPNEPMQLRIGPEIVEKIRFALPDEIYDNKGLINWFHISLYQIPAEDFLRIIGDVISDDESRVKKGQKEFEFILRDAKKLMMDYEEYKSDKDSGSYDDYQDDDDVMYGDDDQDDDQDDLDDFLSGLGIVRPN
jgi:hypothetical protein